MSGGPEASNTVRYVDNSDGGPSRSSANLKDQIDARDFGVRCDGSTDDTAAINSLLTSKAGKHIVLPAGNCLYDGGGVLGNGTLLSGNGRMGSAGSGGTRLLVNTAEPAQLLTASGFAASIRDLSIISNVKQTGGAWVLLSGWAATIQNVYFSGDYNGIRMLGAGNEILNVRMENGAAGSTRIIAAGGDTSDLIDGVLIGADNGIQRAGIEVKNNSALIISNTSVIKQGIGLLVDPAAGETVSSLFVHDCFFDNSLQQNIYIAPSGNGNVVRARFSGVWAGSSHNADGVSISNAGSGTVEGLHFVDLHAALNYGSGVTTAGAVSDITFIGGEFSGNSSGLHLKAGTNIILEGATVGAAAGIAGNTTGTIVEHGVSNYNIIGNIVRGNTANQLVDNGGNVSKNVTNNLGVNPITANLSPSSSPYIFTNDTGGPIEIYVMGGIVSSVLVDSSIVATTSWTSFTLPRGSIMKMVYSSAPIIRYKGL